MLKSLVAQKVALGSVGVARGCVQTTSGFWAWPALYQSPYVGPGGSGRWNRRPKEDRPRLDRHPCHQHLAGASPAPRRRLADASPTLGRRLADASSRNLRFAAASPTLCAAAAALVAASPPLRPRIAAASPTLRRLFADASPLSPRQLGDASRHVRLVGRFAHVCPHAQHQVASGPRLNPPLEEPKFCRSRAKVGRTERKQRRIRSKVESNRSHFRRGTSSWCRRGGGARRRRCGGEAARRRRGGGEADVSARGGGEAVDWRRGGGARRRRSAGEVAVRRRGGDEAAARRRRGGAGERRDARTAAWRTSGRCDLAAV